MQTGSFRLVALLVVAALTIAVVLFSAKMFADETEKADPTSDVAVIPDADEKADSLYALIQQEFLRLEPIWKEACYDCHSDKTVYPWYYKLPIVRGMIDDDIEEARNEIDMSKGFPFVTTRRPVDALSKLGREVAEGGMPPGKYKLMHWSASLSSAEKESVAVFVESSLKVLAAHGIVPTPRPNRPEGN